MREAGNIELVETIQLLKSQVWCLQRAAQDREGYIHDLLASQQKLIAAIKQVCDPVAGDLSHEGYLADKVQAIINNPPSSIAQEREARLAVFSKQDQEVKDRIDDTVRAARSKRLEGSDE